MDSIAVYGVRLNISVFGLKFYAPERKITAAGQEQEGKARVICHFYILDNNARALSEHERHQAVVRVRHVAFRPCFEPFYASRIYSGGLFVKHFVGAVELFGGGAWDLPRDNCTYFGVGVGINPMVTRGKPIVLKYHTADELLFSCQGDCTIQLHVRVVVGDVYYHARGVYGNGGCDGEVTNGKIFAVKQRKNARAVVSAGFAVEIGRKDGAVSFKSNIFLALDVDCHREGIYSLFERESCTVGRVSDDLFKNGGRVVFEHIKCNFDVFHYVAPCHFFAQSFL